MITDHSEQAYLAQTDVPHSLGRTRWAVANSGEPITSLFKISSREFSVSIKQDCGRVWDAVLFDANAEFP